MKLRVWHIANPPNEGFHVDVTSIEEAKVFLRLLAHYDNYLGDVVSSNAQGLQEWDEEEWVDYYDEEGRDINEIMGAV